jgi:hypothetical protein
MTITLDVQLSRLERQVSFVAESSNAMSLGTETEASVQVVPLLDVLNSTPFFDAGSPHVCEARVSCAP